MLVTERNRRHAYIQDERRQVYQDFIERLERSTQYQEAVRQAAETQDMTAVREAVATKMPNKPILKQHYRRILLIGSPAAAKAAVRAFNIDVLVLSLAVESVASGFDEEKWGSLALRIEDIKWSFIKIARRDLGLWGRRNSLAAFDTVPMGDASKSDVDVAITLLNSFLSNVSVVDESDA